MARLVIPRSAKNGNLASASIDERPPDDYVDRLIKYIPAEPVAFFIFVDKFVAVHIGIDSIVGTNMALSPSNLFLSLSVFLLGLIGTPIYFYKSRDREQPWVLNASLATVAYVCWAYTVGGSVFLLLGWYHMFYAGLCAPIFTFVAGFLRPAPRR